MMKHKKNVLTACGLALLMIPAAAFFFSEKNQTTPVPAPAPVSTSSEYKVMAATPTYLSASALSGKPHVSVIGDVSFSLEDAFVNQDEATENNYIRITYVPEQNIKGIDRDSRFILVDNAFYQKQTDHTLQTQINQWIFEKRTVFLMGENLTNEDIQSVFGKEHTRYEIESATDMNYPLYGIGYSPNEKQVIPLFLVINSEGIELKKDMIDFLIRKKAY